MASSRPSELTAHLGYWLRYVSNHVSHAFGVKLAAKGVTVAEWVMMRSLYGKNPMPPSRLAEEMGMTRGAVSKLADRLIDKSLIVRRANYDDGRAQTLTLTAEGAKIVPDLAALADQNDAEFINCLSMTERNILVGVLKRMVAQYNMKSIPTE